MNDLLELIECLYIGRQKRMIFRVVTVSFYKDGEWRNGYSELL